MGRESSSLGGSGGDVYERDFGNEDDEGGRRGKQGNYGSVDGLSLLALLGMYRS